MAGVYESRSEVDACLTDDQVVCAVLMPDGSPRYFLAAGDASEATVRGRAFAIREGRPMNDIEALSLRIAEVRAEAPC